MCELLQIVSLTFASNALLLVYHFISFEHIWNKMVKFRIWIKHEQQMGQLTCQVWCEMWIWGSCGWWGVEAVSPLWWGLAEPSWRLIELLCRARTPALRWCPAPQIDSWSVRMVKLKSVSVNCRPEIGWRCLMLKLTQVESGKWWKILKRKWDLGMRRLQGDFSCNMHGPQWHGRPPFPHE